MGISIRVSECWIAIIALQKENEKNWGKTENVCEWVCKAQMEWREKKNNNQKMNTHSKILKRERMTWRDSAKCMYALLNWPPKIEIKLSARSHSLRLSDTHTHARINAHKHIMSFERSMMIFICKNGESCIEIIALFQMLIISTGYSTVLLFDGPMFMLTKKNCEISDAMQFSLKISKKFDGIRILIEIPSNTNKIMLK